jgi:hypothetical protein
MSAEPNLLELAADVLALSEDALWAVEINFGGAALLSHKQPMVYITGLAVHQASTAYRSQGNTDAKDAYVGRSRDRRRAAGRLGGRRSVRRSTGRVADRGDRGRRRRPGGASSPRSTRSALQPLLTA